MKIHEDPLFTFELEREPGILRFLWTEKTAHMTDGDFTRALSLYADFAAKHRASALLVDMRKFRHQPGPEMGKWRNEVLVPRYRAAGVRRICLRDRKRRPHASKAFQHDGRKGTI